MICDRPVVEVCPTEWARMANRSVLQWDKDDCAAAGLVKFDLLGLGMLSAIHYAIDLVREHHGVEVDLAMLPQQDEVYEMLCRADTVGVFQIESRAQMATLPRLRPRCFYDLVVEVALIRPGPIQGGSVHPYIRRRKGEEPVTYLHPLLKNSLREDPGHTAVPGTADADGHRCGGLQPGRGRSATPGHGVQTVRGSHGRTAGTLRRRAGCQRDHRRGSRADLGQVGGVRQLRVPGIAFGELRLPGLFVLLAEVTTTRPPSAPPC